MYFCIGILLIVVGWLMVRFWPDNQKIDEEYNWYFISCGLRIVGLLIVLISAVVKVWHFLF